MPKRAADQVAHGSQPGQPFSKASTSGAKRDPAVEEMGEFEDAWEDEIESDDEVVVVGDEEGNSEDGVFLLDIHGHLLQQSG